VVFVGAGSNARGPTLAVPHVQKHGPARHAGALCLLRAGHDLGFSQAKGCGGGFVLVFSGPGSLFEVDGIDCYSGAATSFLNAEKSAPLF
jgi:hypothetical protein